MGCLPAMASGTERKDSTLCSNQCDVLDCLCDSAFLDGAPDQSNYRRAPTVRRLDNRVALFGCFRAGCTRDWNENRRELALYGLFQAGYPCESVAMELP